MLASCCAKLFFFFNSIFSKAKVFAKPPFLLLLLLNTEMKIFLSLTSKKGNVILHINHQQMSLFSSTQVYAAFL